MSKIICSLIFFINLSFANSDTVKPSELELFLFKVGFDSLLKDVDITKEKTTLNEDEIKVINKKISFIMDEMNKKNLNLIGEKNENTINPNLSSELKTLREEILELRNEIQTLKDTKKVVYKKEVVKKTETTISNDSFLNLTTNDYFLLRKNSKILNLTPTKHTT